LVDRKLLSIFLLIVAFIASISYASAIAKDRFGENLYTIKPSVYRQTTHPSVDGDPKDWPFLTRLHPDVKVDGSIDDWYTEQYPVVEDRITRSVSTNYSRNIYVWDLGNGNKYLYYKGEFIWFDALKDTRNVSSYYPEADLTEVRVSGNQTHLLILVRVADLRNVGDPSNPSLLLSIPIDIDMNYLNGNTTTIDKNTNVSRYAPWDYQLVIDLTNPKVKPGEKGFGDGVKMSDKGAPLDIYDPSYKDVSTNKSVFVANPATDSIEIAIAWSDLGVSNPWNVSNVRLYVLSFLGNGYGVPATNLTGSQLLDAVSNTTTDDEAGDGVVDYWLDIGFTTACEPTYYYSYVLGDKGFIQAYSDLSGDMRTDYIVNEAFDTDILTATLWIIPEDDSLYILIHMKGLAEPLGNVSPAIAIVIDTTPLNFSDGNSSWIISPNIGYTDTELGVSSDFNAPYRSVNWTHLIWIYSRITAGKPEYWVYVYNVSGIAYSSNKGVNASHHFIEAWVPLDKISTDLGARVFRWEVLCFAYVLSTSQIPGLPIDSIIDLHGSNIYDVIAPYSTYGTGVENIGDKPYARDGEVYDSDNDVGNDLSTLNGDHWIDVFNTRKYPVILINVTLNHTSFDNDSFIEIGEPAVANATLLYYNGSAWAPLPNKYVTFYLIGVDNYMIKSLGGNFSDGNGTVILDLGDIAINVTSGRYRLRAVYEPDGVDRYMYFSVYNTSLNEYVILHQPFIQSLPETNTISLILLTSIVLTLLLKKYCSRNRS